MSLLDMLESLFIPDFLFREECQPYSCERYFLLVRMRFLILSASQILTIYDLTLEEAQGALKRIRRYTSLPILLEETLTQAISILGGRLAYLNRVSRAHDVVGMARQMLAVEKGWLLSQIGLIQDCDDDVMDEVRFTNAEIGVT